MYIMNAKYAIKGERERRNKVSERWRESNTRERDRSAPCIGTDLAGANATSHAFWARKASRLTGEGFEVDDVILVESCSIRACQPTKASSR